MINRKAKGTAAERELLHLFWEYGWACSRIAGSGNTHHPSPDLLAGNGQKVLALECKTLKNNIKYFDEEEISQLLIFSQIFGAEPWIAIKFDRKPWFLLKINDLEQTNKKKALSLKLAELKGIDILSFFKINQKI